MWLWDVFIKQDGTILVGCLLWGCFWLSQGFQRCGDGEVSEFLLALRVLVWDRSVGQRTVLWTPRFQMSYQAFAQVENFFHFNLKKLCVWVFCIHAYLFTRCVPGVQHKPEKSIKTHWDWSCELPSRKTELWSSSRAESSLNHWAISPGSPKHDRGMYMCMCMYVCQICIPNIVIHQRLHDNQEFTVLVMIPKVLILCSNNYLQR